jgi:hypothetical protein
MAAATKVGFARGAATHALPAQVAGFNLESPWTLWADADPPLHAVRGECAVRGPARGVFRLTDRVALRHGVTGAEPLAAFLLSLWFLESFEVLCRLFI